MKRPILRGRRWLEDLSEEKVRRIRAWTARGILLMTCISLFVFLCHRGTRYAERLDYFRVDPADIRLTERPAWVSDEIEKGILDVPCLAKPFNIFEPGVTARIAVSIETSPWVRKVTAVRQQFPHNLSIEMELRRPVAYVDYQGAFYAVDRLGVRLPVTARKLERAPWRLPCILMPDGAPPAVAEEWQGEVVRSASLVADTIDAADKRLPVQLAAIDVRLKWSGGEADSVVTLYSLDGPHIIWGSPPGMEHHTEPKSEQKIANLVDFVEKKGSLAGMEYVDLRWGSTVYWKDRPFSTREILSASRSVP